MMSQHTTVAAVIHASFVWRLAVRQSVIEKKVCSNVCWRLLAFSSREQGESRENMSNCLCLPSVRHRDSLSQSRLEIGFHQIEEYSTSRFLFLLFFLIVLPSNVFFLSGLIAIWPTSVKKEKFHWLLPFQEDYPLHEAALCGSAKAVLEAVFLSRVYLWIFFGGFSVWSKHQL